MNVRELGNEEMLQLKTALFYGSDIMPQMTMEHRRILEDAMYIEDIPDELVYELYEGISFVPDHFWCRMAG